MSPCLGTLTGISGICSIVAVWGGYGLWVVRIFVLVEMFGVEDLLKSMMSGLD